MEKTPILKTEKLTYKYSVGTPFERTAIKDIDLEIYSGDFIGVIGKTGSGKSTLIQHFNGILRPSSGKIIFNGRDIWEKGYDRSRLCFDVGLVFQYPEYQLFEETVALDVGYGPKNMGLSPEEIAERVDSALSFVGLDLSVKDKSPFELSGGQKRRVAIAGIIAMSPKVLILDEPTAGLDPKARDDLLEKLKAYRESTGTTVLLVSHSMEDIANYTDKVIVVNNGSIAMFDDKDAIFSHAEELASMGLSVPQITRVFLKLKSKGFDVNTSIYSTEKARDEIIRLLEVRK